MRVEFGSVLIEATSANNYLLYHSNDPQLFPFQIFPHRVTYHWHCNQDISYYILQVRDPVYYHWCCDKLDMEDAQRLQAKQRGFKSGVTKLLAKISDTTSMELERINAESVIESQRVTVASVLAQLKTKRDQIAELDNSIIATIWTETEVEDEICNANTY